MKISCATCSAQYALADEKVAGRSFKVRCKKCGSPIVVRGEKPEEVMTGVRNESSLLFSVSMLHAPPPAKGETTEGSGLIDIKKLASAIEAKPSAKPAPDLFASFSATPMAPVLAAPAPKKRAPLLAIVTGISAAAVAASLAALVVVVVAVGNDSDARADVPVARPEPIVVVDPPVEPEPIAPVIVETPDPEPAPIAIEPRRRPRPRPVVREVPPVREEEPEQEESFEQITRELDGRPRVEPPREELPQTPSRSDVQRALEGLAGAVRTCGGGARGMAPTRIVFSGETGRVTDAQVTGGALPPEARSCIARAVRSAHLPRFEQRTFSVTYPFSL